MNLLKKTFQFISFRIIGRKRTISFFKVLFHFFELDMLDVAHKKIGIANYGEESFAGELNFLYNILKPILTLNRIDSPIIFDVGANIGHYTKDLLEALPKASVYAFEPNPFSFTKLTESISGTKNVKAVNEGLGARKSTLKMFTYAEEQESEHATMVQDVLKELFNRENTIAIDVNVTTLDEFCLANEITKIGLLKIDTEGFELEVLKGAKQLLAKKAIDVIQFEFNEMNVLAGVFLKNFYDLLGNFSFYRILPNGILPLGEYNPKNEIFRYQNIVAFHNELIIDENIIRGVRI